MNDHESVPSRRKPGPREREVILNAVKDPFSEKTDKILRFAQNDNKEITKNNSHMKKSKVIFFGVVIVVVVALALWAGVLIAGMQSGSNPDGLSQYSAVYLSTGDIYFGKLSWFPSPHMTDVWLIQRSQSQSGQTQTSLVSFKSAVWGPADEISFNSQDIVFSARLKNGSQMVQAMENPSSVTGQSGSGTGTQGAASDTTQSPSTGSSASSTK